MLRKRQKVSKLRGFRQRMSVLNEGRNWLLNQGDMEDLKHVQGIRIVLLSKVSAKKRLSRLMKSVRNVVRKWFCAGENMALLWLVLIIPPVSILKKKKRIPGYRARNVTARLCRKKPGKGNCFSAAVISPNVSLLPGMNR